MTHAVLFDTDPGIDDAMALLFAHFSPSIELVGVTTTFGNAAIETTTRNAQYLVDTFAVGCPVHQGAAVPLQLELDDPPTFVHGVDGLGDAGVPVPPLRPTGDAVDFIIDTLRRRPGEITIVAVGRMTNLAAALARAPEVAALVKGVVIMGGALGRNGFTGNITSTAEANIYGDPHAAARVMAAPWPVIMVGLDVTMQTIMRAERVQDLARQAGDVGEFLQRISAHYLNFYRSERGVDGFPIHDSSALAYLLAPELFHLAAGPIAVATAGDTMGQTVLKDRASADNLPEQAACVAVQADAVVDLYMDTLINA